MAYAVDKLKKGELHFAVEDPDNPTNFPRELFLWRANLLGASGKGHEYFLKHLLGVDNAVLGTDSDLRLEEIKWRDPALEGKLDLLVTLELRMSTSAMYADIALPAAGWYEMHDLNTTDMHPFIHPFNPAIDPPWETRTNWEQFKTIAEKFSQMALDHLGNDWLECFNANGVVMAKAVVSPRIPPGKAFMYHAQERLINTPGSPLSGQRGGTHNSVTRIIVKPTHMIGGYAQLSYGFNYYGLIGSQRDETIIVRKAGEVDWYED